MTDMAVNDDGKGTGDAPAPKRKRAPTARKRTPKAVQAEQNGSTATEREVAPQAQPVPAQTQAKVDRGTDESRNPGQRTSGERPVDVASSDDGDFAERDADRAADVAADLKSWMDTRREDGEARGEVL
jgi:hypothetical protein